jgi:hypothetical protein
MTRKINPCFFWTGSSTVRNWICAIASIYQMLVGHRVGEIQPFTEQVEWRFIPGRLNPVDEATWSTIEEEVLSVLC